jgi:23S rRNA pseudouridine1911/1915/1917 synthase
MSGQRVEFQVGEAGTRLDRYLADRVPELSRSAIQKLIDLGRVRVGGAAARASYKVRTGDVLVLDLPPPEQSALAAEAIPLRIVYEDAALLVIDKPAGMVVHPAPGHPAGTLVNALLAHCPELAQTAGDRPGIVHRLDRDTSGLMVVAKSDPVRRALQRQFAEHRIHKAYLALLHGHLQPASGRIHAPLGRDPVHRQRIAVQAGGREAATEYRVLEVFDRQTGPAAGEFTLVRAEPETGRTHQIRVHFSSVGHPVVGDAVYGRRRTLLPLDRQFLHAWRLGFDHPETGQRIELETPLPPDLAAVLVLLRSGTRDPALAAGPLSARG